MFCVEVGTDRALAVSAGIHGFPAAAPRVSCHDSSTWRVRPVTFAPILPYLPLFQSSVLLPSCLTVARQSSTAEDILVDRGQSLKDGAHRLWHTQNLREPVAITHHPSLSFECDKFIYVYVPYIYYPHLCSLASASSHSHYSRGSFLFHHLAFTGTSIRAPACPSASLTPALPRITHHASWHPGFLHASSTFLHLFARDPGPLVSPPLSLPFLFGLALRTSSRPLRYDPFPLQLIDDICIRTVLGFAA